MTKLPKIPRTVVDESRDPGATKKSIFVWQALAAFAYASACQTAARWIPCQARDCLFHFAYIQAVGYGADVSSGRLGSRGVVVRQPFRDRM